MSSVVVQVENLSKHFNDFIALQACTLNIQRGTVFGLLGPNGAGKTTLIRLLMGFLQPTQGVARIDGLDCYRNREEVHKRIAYIPGEPRMFRTMRGKQVLRFFADVREEGNFSRSMELANRLELDVSRWVAFMSTGMRQKLALAVCLSIDAPLLIMDEPTANLDPTVRGEVITLVNEAKAAGRTVIFSSHVLSEIEEVCDEVGILRMGQLVHLQSLTEDDRRHRLVARSSGPLPELPAHLRESVSLSHDNGTVEIEAAGSLDPIIPWLQTAKLENINVAPVGLRAIYDQYHGRRVDP